MRRAIFSASLLLLGGCSLVVSGLEPPECTSNDQCAVLNEMDGISNDACTLWQCDAELDRCVLGTRDADRDGLVAPECAGPGDVADCNDGAMGGTERCNGVDDDCDGVIDEAFVQDDMSVSPLPGEVAELRLPLSGVGAGGVVASGSGESGLAVAYASGSATFGLFEGESRTGGTSLQTFRNASQTSLSSSDVTTGCWNRGAASMTFADGSCRYDDLAFGVGADSIFVASVNGAGCAEGQLRVGYMAREDAASGAVIERGPLRKSNAFFGIDTDPATTDGRPCTGASRGGVLGATRPAVGALAMNQALAAWLAAPLSRDACGGTPAEVEILGLHRQQDAGGTHAWVTASNEAQPQALGATLGGGPPAVTGWNSTGYVVAFPVEGGIALHYVERMATPPPYPGSGDPADRAGLETAPLVSTEIATLPTDGPADDVALAPGAIAGGMGQYLGVTWRTGCGSSGGRVYFRQLILSGDDAPSAIAPSSPDAIELTVAAGEIGPPAIAYGFGGFLEPGVEGARPAATQPYEDGGWVIAWAQDGQILARRVSEMDGQLLSPDEVLRLGGAEGPTRSRPMLYFADEVFRYAFLEAGSAETGIREGALTCARPE
ncbi:MAG: putative metal-binding motif-containing protein [Myxococcota bacterium]|nr:putative metal-binding motif-containing protein [Myxococcota bacterium]